MTKPDTTTLVENWEKKITDLEEREERIESNQDSMVKADWPAVIERAEPRLKQKTVRRCLDDVEGSANSDELVKALADWRKEAQERDKRILESKKAFRYSTIRYQLEECIEDFEDSLPEDLFPECRGCDQRKKPKRDERYSKGYEWECTDCHY